MSTMSKNRLRRSILILWNSKFPSTVSGSQVHYKCLQGFTGWLRGFSAGKTCNRSRQTTDILLTDSQQTSDSLTLNPATEIGDDTRSQFWKAVWISSPNLVTIRLLDRLLTDSRQTTDILLTDSEQTFDSLTLNPETEIGDDTRSQFGELFKSALQILLLSLSQKQSS